MVTKNQRPLAFAGLILALGFPSLPISDWENEFNGVAHLIGYEIIWWVAIAGLLLYVRLAEKRPLSSIGFRSPLRLPDILIAAGAGILILAGLAVIDFVLLPALHLDEQQAIARLIATPFWWRFISVIRAAVGEEVLFRGYAIERTAELTGSLRFASLLSWVIFTVDHVSNWGWSHVLIAGFGGLALTALYLWRRNLWINIIAHFLVDGVSVLLG
jgi:uncharacterized protein